MENVGLFDTLEFSQLRDGKKEELKKISGLLSIRSADLFCTESKGWNFCTRYVGGHKSHTQWECIY